MAKDIPGKGRKPTPTRKDPLAAKFSVAGRVVTGSFLGLVLALGMGGWAVTTRLAGAVVAPGMVFVDGEIKTVQQIDGGVVREIAVDDGDDVAAGQVLVRLDDVQIRAERDILIGQLGELCGRKARLTAERDLMSAIDFPSGFATSYANAETIMSGEEKLFTGNVKNRKTQKDQLQAQLTQLTEQIRGLTAQHRAQADELLLAQEERERIGTLAKGGLIEGSKVNALDRDIARMQGQVGELEASLAATQGKLSEINLQILAVDDAARTDAQRQLRDLDAQVGELEERLRAVRDRLARTQVRAPVAGVVTELGIHTIGGVITPAQPLMSIVPSDADLAVQFRVATRDIDQLAIGQSARLRFSAFNRRTTPEINGTVTRISAAAARDPLSGELFYLAEVKITGDLEPLGNHRLVPGMPVEVFVQTEEQIALAYFVKPFTDQIARAFREE